jgi:hypothetical protein
MVSPKALRALLGTLCGLCLVLVIAAPASTLARRTPGILAKISKETFRPSWAESSKRERLASFVETLRATGTLPVQGLDLHELIRGIGQVSTDAKGGVGFMHRDLLQQVSGQ